MESTLRATQWSEFIGQEKLKARLTTHINAARADGKMMEHVLLMGPPGFGKTTMARIIAAQLLDPLKEFVAPIKIKALERELKSWGDGGVLFIDEIHRFSKAEQEDLYSVFTDGVIHSPSGRTIQLPPITIIGATTEPERLSPPMFDRFPIQLKVAEYSDAEMALILQGMAGRIDFELNDGDALALARATGGVPRIAERFVLGGHNIEANDREATVAAILDLTGMDADGLSDDQVEYLTTLADLGGEAGIETLSAMLQVSTTVLKRLERLLLKRQFLVYGPKGRELTNNGFTKVRANVTQQGVAGPKTRRDRRDG